MNDQLCGCGSPVRYSHIRGGKEVMSCNKYVVCLTWDQQSDVIKKIQNQNNKMKTFLQKIAGVNAMDYEYRAWAKEGLRDE